MASKYSPHGDDDDQGYDPWAARNESPWAEAKVPADPEPAARQPTHIDFEFGLDRLPVAGGAEHLRTGLTCENITPSRRNRITGCSALER